MAAERAQTRSCAQVTHRIMPGHTASNSTFMTTNHDVSAVFAALFIVCLVLASYSDRVTAEGSDLGNAHGARSAFLPTRLGALVSAAGRTRLSARFDAFDHIV